MRCDESQIDDCMMCCSKVKLTWWCLELALEVQSLEQPGGLKKNAQMLRYLKQSIQEIISNPLFTQHNHYKISISKITDCKFNFQITDFHFVQYIFSFLFCFVFLSLFYILVEHLNLQIQFQCFVHLFSYFSFCLHIMLFSIDCRC